jgi:hypothetical protein
MYRDVHAAVGKSKQVKVGILGLTSPYLTSFAPWSHTPTFESCSRLVLSIRLSVSTIVNVRAASRRRVESKTQSGVYYVTQRCFDDEFEGDDRVQ